MPESLKQFLKRWAVSTVAVLVATYVVPGIRYERWPDLLIATLVLGLLNGFLRPLLMLVSLPLLILTLGLFTLVINALLLLVVNWLLSPKFVVDGFKAAILGALVISVVSMLLNVVTGTGRAKVTVQRKARGDHDDNSGGPVIDV